MKKRQSLSPNLKYHLAQKYDRAPNPPKHLGHCFSSNNPWRGQSQEGSLSVCLFKKGILGEARFCSFIQQTCHLLAVSCFRCSKTPSFLHHKTLPLWVFTPFPAAYAWLYVPSSPLVKTSVILDYSKLYWPPVYLVTTFKSPFSQEKVTGLGRKLGLHHIWEDCKSTHYRCPDKRHCDPQRMLTLRWGTRKGSHHSKGQPYIPTEVGMRSCLCCYFLTRTLPELNHSWAFHHLFTFEEEKESQIINMVQNSYAPPLQIPFYREIIWNILNIINQCKISL